MTNIHLCAFSCAFFTALLYNLKPWMGLGFAVYMIVWLIEMNHAIAMEKKS